MAADAYKTYERFVFKPTILRAFGWQVIDISSHSLWQDKDAVIAMIEAELERGELPEGYDDPFADILQAASVSVPRTKPKVPEVDEVAPPSTDDWQTFRLKRGSSDKFWRIAQRGTDLGVNYGRSGTKGQTVTKSFDDEARAKREATKLILQKTRKGYVEE